MTNFEGSPRNHGLFTRLHNPQTRRSTILMLVIGGIFTLSTCLLLVFASLVPPLHSVESPYAPLLEGTWVLAADSPRPSGYDVQITFHRGRSLSPVSYTHLRAHETVLDLVCRLLLEKKK